MGAYRGVTVADDQTVLGEREVTPGSWVRFQAGLRLLWIQEASDRSPVAAEEIWRVQDGYGQRGHTPPQGWDWSGIRDSSPAAVAEMFTLARRHLPDRELAAVLGMDAATLTRVVETAL